METQVAIYAIKVKKQGVRGSDQKLNNIDKAGDLLDFFQDLMKTGPNSDEHHKHEAISSAARFTDVEFSGRTIQGRLEIGSYGESCPVIDVDSSKQVFKKGQRHADMRPMFFRLDVPKDRDEAILIVQKSRKARVKSTFVSMIKAPFETEYNELQLSVSPFMPAEVFKKFLNVGTVQKLRFLRMTIPSDFADSYDSGHQEILGTAELVIKARRNGDLPIKSRIMQFVSSKRPIRDFYSIPNFEFDNVKVSVRIGKRTRNVDLGNKRTTPLYELIDLSQGSDGQPTYESMKEAVGKLRDELVADLYAVKG